ncbi:hypothetical protein PR048_024679 [Dryococelus australis]|uniref:Uncharacterized protein n=1 Tax=Dryococelus australis TaxID=614101 RepID=A0ABQ9GP85_9NEOP|nr:hypothetical protein PR048_024679 [Dryococelus australis]
MSDVSLRNIPPQPASPDSNLEVVCIQTEPCSVVAEHHSSSICKLPWDAATIYPGLMAGRLDMALVDAISSCRDMSAAQRCLWSARCMSRRPIKAPVYQALEVPCSVYTQHDDNTARQFRALRLAAMGDLMRVAVSPLTLPRLSASNTEKSSRQTGVLNDPPWWWSAGVDSSLLDVCVCSLLFLLSPTPTHSVDRTVQMASNTPKCHTWLSEADYAAYVKLYQLGRGLSNALSGHAACSLNLTLGGGKTGYPRENPPTSGIVRHDSHLRKCGDLAGDWTRFALVGSEQANRSATVTPSLIIVCLQTTGGYRVVLVGAVRPRHEFLHRVCTAVRVAKYPSGVSASCGCDLRRRSDYLDASAFSHTSG